MKRLLIALLCLFLIAPPALAQGYFPGGGTNVTLPLSPADGGLGDDATGSANYQMLRWHDSSGTWIPTTNTLSIDSAASNHFLRGTGTGFTDSLYELPALPSPSGFTAGRFFQASGASVIDESAYGLPAVLGTSGKILISDGTNYVSSTPAYPNAAGSAGKIVISDGTDLITSTPTYPNAAGAAGKLLQSDGTNLVMSTPTFPTTAGTSGKILISDGTNIISSTPTYPNSAGTSGNILTSDGTNITSAALTAAQMAAAVAPGTSGNVLTSNGTTWTSAAAAGGMTDPMTTQGDMITRNSGGSPARIAAVASGKYLRSAGTSTEPVWSTLTLPNSASSGQIMRASSSNTIGMTTATYPSTAGITGNVLSSDGTNINSVDGGLNLPLNTAGYHWVNKQLVIGATDATTYTALGITSTITYTGTQAASTNDKWRLKHTTAASTNSDAGFSTAATASQRLGTGQRLYFTFTLGSTITNSRLIMGYSSDPATSMGAAAPTGIDACVIRRDTSASDTTLKVVVSSTGGGAATVADTGVDASLADVSYRVCFVDDGINIYVYINGVLTNTIAPGADYPSGAMGLIGQVRTLNGTAKHCYTGQWIQQERRDE